MGIIKDILYVISNKRFLPIFKKQSIFPYYHLVSNHKPAHIKNLYEFKNCSQFINDVDFLANTYKPINPSNILQHSIPNNGFLLSFDDGLREIYTVIYPILKQKNIKALFFVNPNFIDNKKLLYKHSISVIINYLDAINFEKQSLDTISNLFSFKYINVEDFKNKLRTIKFSEREKVNSVLKLLNIDINTYLQEQKPYITKAQIHEMIADGFYFGGHTMSHPYLDKLSHEEQKAEIINSIEWLKEHFNLNYSFFAFPFSDKPISKKLIDALFVYDSNLILFGNSGIKKDIDPRIIQRFSLENPKKQIEKQIITENFYKYYNKFIGKYDIKRT